MRRALAALALITGAVLAAAPSSRDAGTVTLEPPPGVDTLNDVTPAFTIRTEGFAPGELPLAVWLQISTSPDFSTPLVVDTSIFDASDSVRIELQRPLPERSRLYFRARVRTAQGGEVLSGVSGPRFTPPWLTLVSPNEPNGTTVTTQRPTFVWSSPEVRTPPGPWRYTLTIRNVATGMETIVRDLLDTTYTPPFALESNTSYRWSVVAALPQDTARTSSRATFVILDPNAPLTTLLYQNFPNPFPSAGSLVTCFWFDLRTAGAVALDVYDLRGRHVRRIAPRGSGEVVLTAGRYGRAPGTADTGCDVRYTWDGTGADGNVVPPGVYLVRLRAGSSEQRRKVLFVGR